MDAFAEDSKMIGHPQNLGELNGKAAIKAALGRQSPLLGWTWTRTRSPM